MRDFFPEAERSLMQIVLGDDFYGDWTEHYAAWMNRPDVRRLCLRFEDLPNATPETIQEIARFIGHQGAIEPWQNPMKDLHRSNPRFFRQGQTVWSAPAEWTESIDYLFWHRHGAQMAHFGYSPPPDFTLSPDSRASLEEINRLSNDWLKKSAALLKICEERQGVIDMLAKARAAPVSNVSPSLARRLKLAACKTPHPLGQLRQYPPRKIKPPATPKNPPPSAPGFCIVTPSYQQGRFLERTLKSVLDQSYPKVRYGVQDGGSTDETLEVLNRHSARLAFHDSRPDRGQADAINTGFARLKPGDDEIMAWLNSDDVLLPGTLARVAAYFDRNPGVDVVYGHRVIIDENDREVGRWYLPRHTSKNIEWVDFVPQETLFWRSRAWKHLGGLDASFQFAMDWDFILRLQSAGYVIRRIPAFLGCFRIHEQQKTQAQIHLTGEKEMRLLRERHAVSDEEARRHIRSAINAQSLQSGWVRRLWTLGIRY